MTKRSYEPERLAKYTDEELETHSLELQEQFDELKAHRTAMAEERERRAAHTRVDSMLLGLSDADAQALVERITGQPVEPSMLAEERAKLEKTQSIGGAGGVKADAKIMETLEG